MSWTEAKPVQEQRESRPESKPGTLTLQAIRYSRGVELRLVAYPAVLRELPWFRGGAAVSVVVGDRERRGLVRVVRDGPHVLMTQADGLPGSLQKLPPVQLRLAALAWMNGEDHPETELSYRIVQGFVEWTLPGWAAPPAMVEPAYSGPLGKWPLARVAGGRAFGDRA